MDKIVLDLKGKHVRLIPYDEKYIDYLYNHIIMDKIEGFENFNIKQKKDLYEYFNKKNIVSKIFVKNIYKDEICGYIAAYNYNKLDGYIYITSVLENEHYIDEEALSIFINYLFICFPIRKIYCEILETNTYKKNIFQNIGFHIEAVLTEDVFFDGKYCDKNILSLYREDYGNV